MPFSLCEWQLHFHTVNRPIPCTVAKVLAPTDVSSSSTYDYGICVQISADLIDVKVISVMLNITV